MRIYLCSRVSFDARQVNNRVAAYLRRMGMSVFVPHEAPYNQSVDPSVPDETVYRLDKSEMVVADLCVVVGKIGVDCAFEVGWFEANGVPIVWVFPPKDVRSPMLFAVPKVRSLQAVRKFVTQQEDAITRETA